jgi:hypothetical protein
MCIRRLKFFIRCILATTLAPVCLGCEASGAATTGSLLQGVTVSVVYPNAGGGIEGHDDLIAGDGWKRFYWKGPTAGEVKVEIDHFCLQVNGRHYGYVELGAAVLIDAMNGIDVKVNGQLRRPTEGGK